MVKDGSMAGSISIYFWSCCHSLNLGGYEFNSKKQVSKNLGGIGETRWLSYACITLGSVIVALSLWHLGLNRQAYAG